MSILKVVFSGDTTQLDKALTKAQSGLDNFSKKAKDVGGKMSLFITAPIVAAGGAAIKFASDFEESLNKVDVAFKGSSGQVKAFAKTALNSFGIAEGSALDMAALFGDMSTSMGISQGEAAKLSTSLVGLAGDLASFKNMNIEEVTTALNGVFTGETESLKRLGVVMTEANLQQFALSQGMKGNIKDFTQAQKVMLRYEYVMSMTSNAHGDFIRTGGGAANQMRVFQEGLKELGVLFGQEMLPLFTDMVKSLNDLIKRFKELSPETKKTILIVAGITAAMGPLLMVIGSMASGLSAVISGLRMAIPVLTKFGTVLAGVNLAAAGVVTAVLAGAAAVVYMGQKIGPNVSALETLKNALLSVGGAGFAMKQGLSEAAAQAELNRKETAALTGAGMKRPATVTEKPMYGAALLGAGITDIPAETAKKIDMTPVVNALKLPSYGIKKVTQTWDELPRSLGPTIANTEAIIAKNIDSSFVLIENGQIAAMDKLAALNSGITDILNQGLQGMVVGVASALGAAAAGAEGGIGALSKVLLGGIADMAIQLGQLAIGVGLTIEAIKKSLENLGPGAIIAGIALVALGSFVKGQAAKIGAGQGGDRGRSSMPAFANGGIVSGPTIGLMGEYPGAKSNPEVIAPLDKLQSMLNNNGGGNVHVGGEFVVRGQDLVVALQRADKTRNRIKG
jgi:hypothetical protein